MFNYRYKPTYIKFEDVRYVRLDKVMCYPPEEIKLVTTVILWDGTMWATAAMLEDEQDVIAQYLGFLEAVRNEDKAVIEGAEFYPLYNHGRN